MINFPVFFFSRVKDKSSKNLHVLFLITCNKKSMEKVAGISRESGEEKHTPEPHKTSEPYKTLYFFELNFDYMKMITRFAIPKSLSDRLKRL